MAGQLKATWTGITGTTYSYDVFSIRTTWNDVPGNYIFTKESSPGRWTAIYIGETESFKDRLPNHNALLCINRNGATHIHVHQNQSSQVRLAEEDDITRNNPPLCP